MLVPNLRCLFIQNAPISNLRMSTDVRKVQSILGSNKIATDYICNFLDETNVHFSKLESVLSKFMRYCLGQDINKLAHYPVYLKSVLTVSTYLTDLDHDVYSTNSLHEESNLFKTMCSNIQSCDEAKFDVLDKDLSDLVFSGVWRISMGPSSSHFTGVYNAASNYRSFLQEQSFNLTKINVFLHDSMQLGSAGTGFGHDTHKAIRAGLSNQDLS